MGTTAVILAAGENTRLQVMGLPPGKKPLMVHDGEVLIRRLCRQARSAGCEDIVIVVSPTNCEDIVFATLDFAPYIVVQCQPSSVTDAMTIGMHTMSAVYADDVLLLMGDNYVPGEINLDAGTPHFIYTRQSTDEALTLVAPPTTRWVGPVFFPSTAYAPGMLWSELFNSFDPIYITSRARDMGTPNEWQ